MSIPQFTSLKVLFFLCISILFFLFIQKDSQKNVASEITVKQKFDPHKLPKINKISKEQKIADRYEQEWEMTRDVTTGLIPKKALSKAKTIKDAQIAELNQKSAIPNVQWSERGPNNVGGRTRAIMFDPNDASAKKVWAGGVGGGLWYANDITATTADWQKVNDFWSNMAVSSITHDPVNKNIFYVATGEGFNNLGSQNGDGIWKSTDGGSTWSHLSNTTSFDNCTKIISWKANHVLVATKEGIQKSTDAGVSWTQLHSGYEIADADYSVNGDLYVSTFDGDVWRSYDDGVSWPYAYNGTKNRVEICTAPSDNNVVYALINDSGNGNDVTTILRSNDRGQNWVSKTIPMYKNQDCSLSTTPFTRGQGWYSVASLVDPNDANTIIVGGIDLHRSEDGGNTWEGISYWTSGGCDAEVHADQHALVTRPGFPNAILSGNDGGVYYSDNAFAAGSNPTFNHQVTNFNITQFYCVGMHPDAGSNIYLAGAQDNGTQQFSNGGISDTYEVTGGDGGFCHIDQTDGNLRISSYTRNNYRYTTTGSTSYTYENISSDGRFINPTDFDNTSNILYAAAASGKYRWVKGFGGTVTHGTVTIPFGDMVSCVKVSPNTTDRVYFGVGNGKIFRVNNAGSAPSYTDLGSPQDGYVSSIAIQEGNDNHLLATYSNYNRTSVYESIDAGANWISIEGDLPNMPVRDAIFNPSNSDQAIIGTELGVWTTDDINGAGTDWEPSNSGLSNTRIDKLEYRTSDKLVSAGTHGRGMFTSESFNGSAPCQICEVTLGTQTCDPATGKYTQELTVVLNNTPAGGAFIINGQNFTYPYNTTTTTQTYTLTNLTPDGAVVDFVASYQSFPAITKTISDLWTAPAAGCAGFNTTCATASVITAPGTISTDGPSSGNGATNSPAVHADWFKFTAPIDGPLNIKSCGQGVDTRLWVYSGSCTSLTQVAYSDDNCASSPTSNQASEITINVTAGTTYYIEWDNRYSPSGFDFEITFNQEIERFGDVTLGAQTCDPATGKYSQTISVVLKNTPAGGAIYVNTQYFTYPYNQAEVTRTYTLTNLTADGAAVDLYIVYQSFPDINLTVEDLWTAPTNCAIVNETCASALLISESGTITADGPASGNGGTAADADHADWYKVTPTVTGLMNVKSCNGGIDTRLWVYSGTCGSLNQIGASDDDCISSGENNFASEVSLNVTAGTTYYIEWDNKWATAGFDFEIALPTPCVVTNKILVDPNAVDNGTGCSWSTAYKYLQDAIDAAELSTDITEIWLKAGYHKPGTQAEAATRFSTFETTKTVSIYGGFAGTETNLNQRNISTNLTYLSGDIGVTNSNIDNIYNVVTHRTAELLTLDGVIIQDGHENSGNNWSGAGIWNTGTITLKDCKLRYNTATSLGSAVYNRNSAAIMTFINTSCEENPGTDFYNTGSFILGGTTQNMIMEQ